jgi:nucleoid-associated protein YgaU
MIGNNEKMKELEGDIQTMKQNIFEKQSQDEDNNLFSEATKSPTITSTPENIAIVITPTEAPIEITPTTIVATPTEKPVEITPTITIAPTPTQQPVMSYNPESLVEYTIKDGDTLASICVRECGDYGMLPAVKDLNQIRDEDVIYVGQVILIPKN